jgi:hypothetical protein
MDTIIQNRERLLGLTWSLEYLVSSGSPIYRVRLKLGSSSEKVRFIDMACSPQELEDLQCSLKEALRSVPQLQGKSS